jgi:hypothetical protein
MFGVSLAEFASAVDAVRCAIDVQRSMAGLNAGLAPEKRIEFRIGINIGDIIIDRGDIFGDGVNVAARIEGVADPGSVCISDDVLRQVRGRVAGEFVDIGERQLKNIARPVRIYEVKFDGGAVNASRPLYKETIAATRLQHAGGESQRSDASKIAGQPDRRYGPPQLILAYLVLPILALLLAHYLLVMKLDLDTAYMRAVSLLLPAIVGLSLYWQAGFGLAAATLLGAAIAIVAIFGMLAIVGLVDSKPIIPSSPFEWQEAIEYALGIALATVAGSALARAIKVARGAIRTR